MAQEPSIDPLVTDHDDSYALALVKQDLEASDRFKREYWPTTKILNRRKVYEGDPEALGWPYESSWGVRPFNNFIFRQINHKISKLMKSPVRLNTRHRRGLDDVETKMMLDAVRMQLERRAREAQWSMGRRLMALDAAKTSFGVRCVGLQYSRGGYKVRNWRVRAEEFHMDPTAEGMDDALWKCWRRYSLAERLGDSLSRHKGLSPAGAGGSLAPDSRPSEIALSDDRILLWGRGPNDRGSSSHGLDMYMVSDYYRDDETQDIYYPCSSCQNYVGMSKVRSEGRVTPVFKCPLCGKEEKQNPPTELMKRVARYPNGWHIRLLNNEIDYNGENRLRLETGDPLVGMAWYDGEAWPGFSETQLLAAPQLMDQIANAMLADAAFSGAHSKTYTVKDAVKSGWNNNPDDIIEISREAMASGGMKTLPPADVSPAVRLLQQNSRENMYLLPGLSPEAQGQAPDTLRSGVGLQRVQLASEIGLYLPLDSLTKADQRFYKILRDLCAMIDKPTNIPMAAPGGITGEYAYDRGLMREPFDVEVITDRDIDEQREEVFSRAMEMKLAQVQGVDDEMLLELSGIPNDVQMRAKQRVAMQYNAQASMGLPPSLGSTPPALGVGSNRGAPPNTGIPAQTGPLNKMQGRLAPSPTRPPARSRGSISASNGASNGAGRV